MEAREFTRWTCLRIVLRDCDCKHIPHLDVKKGCVAKDLYRRTARFLIGDHLCGHVSMGVHTSLQVRTRDTICTKLCVTWYNTPHAWFLQRVACWRKVSATWREKLSRYMREMIISPFWLMNKSAAIIMHVKNPLIRVQHWSDEQRRLRELRPGLVVNGGPK